MTRTETKQGILSRDTVRLVRQPALVECGRDPAHPGGSITVVPLLDGDRVAGFEVRCGCGSAAVVECVYTDQTSDEAP